MWNDLRFALRMLRRSPVFTLVAVLSLALGIGANTSIFSLLDQVLFRLLPVKDPERLVVFHNSDDRMPGMSSSDNHQSVFSYPMYRDLRDKSPVFAGVIARMGMPASLSYEGQTERGRVETVSGNFFDVLGVRAILGRTFTQEEDRTAGAHPVAVLTYGYWMRRFGGSAAILNQKIGVNGHPMVVVGVAPPGFLGVLSGETPDVIVPIAMKRQITPAWGGNLEDRRVRWLNIFARLKPGVSPRQAQAAVQTVYRPILADELAQWGRLRSRRAEQQFLEQRIDLEPASQGINQLRLRWETPLAALMAMVGLVLLIACANIANLMLARAAGRRKEIAVRLAIGGSRAAIMRQLLLESLLLALAGGLLGLLAANWTTDALLRLLPAGGGGGWVTAELNLRLLGFSLALAVVTGLLFGLAPAFQATRTDVAPALKDQPASIASGGAQARFRRALVAAQMSLSLLLLVAAGLFARSLFNLMTVDLGFRPERLMTFSVDPRLSGYDTARGVAFFRELRERLAALPGVRAAGAAFPGPLSGDRRGANITVEGYQPREDEDAGSSVATVTPDYFRAVGTPLIAGREFTERDSAAAQKAVVVNETFAKRYFGERNPIGRHMTFGAGNRITLDHEIVGVVRDNKHRTVREEVGPAAFVPYSQDKVLEAMAFYVRTDRDADSLAREVRGLVRQMDANLPVFEMKSMEVQVEESLYLERLIATLSSAFGLLATLLAAIGLYGVIAYTVARRTAEIGIRMALGALPRNVLWMVMKEAGLLVAIGIAIGLPAALALSRLVESQLFGLKADDPAIFAAATLSLAVVGLLAGLIPGRRAARISPVRALRYE